MARQIDWAEAGVRLRHTPSGPQYGGRNPDWNDTARRWKTVEEYAADTLTARAIEAKVACPYCQAAATYPCLDARANPMPGSPHRERQDAAGALLVEQGWTL